VIPSHAQPHTAALHYRVVLVRCYMRLLDAVNICCQCSGIVNYFPMWLAPNLITLLGTMGLVVGYVASAIYLPEFEGRQCPQRTASSLPPYLLRMMASS
jgi:hypothetical protein